VGGLLPHPRREAAWVPPFHEDDRVTVHHGDCLDVLRTLPDCSVDSVVTDPPAGVAFMGKDWDDDKGGRDVWVAWLASVLAECRRILKPGGHALVWALPRTSGWTHRAIEDAGMDVRDCITHLFGSGFPKSLDVGKAIDKRPGASRHREFAAHLTERRQAVSLSRADVSERVVGTRSGACWNWEHHQFPEAKWWPALRDLLGLDEVIWGPVIAEAERERIGTRITGKGTGRGAVAYIADGENDAVTAPATEDAARWDGWGTALKPSSEMWYLARRPLAGTVAQTVLTHGTGALNIAATRVAGSYDPAGRKPQDIRGGRSVGAPAARLSDEPQECHPAGRWPSNIVLSHSPTCPEDGCEPSCAVAELDRQSGTLTSGDGAGSRRNTVGGNGVTHGAMKGVIGASYADSGGASRFFPAFKYQAKAPTRERPKVDGVAHPTCKPVALMRWLIRLVTPPGGTVLDPFAGSGTTAEAAILEGFRCITIEREAEYLPLILARIERQQPVEEPRPTAQQMSLLDEGAA
jgi:hypothetical protein